MHLYDLTDRQKRDEVEEVKQQKKRSHPDEEAPPGKRARKEGEEESTSEGKVETPQPPRGENRKSRDFTLKLTHF